MSYTLILEEEAVFDIQQAFEWYEEQKSGLGYFFLEELDNCYQKISSYPFHYTSINHWLRRIKVHKFPYLIIYEIEGNNVIINTIRHTGRNPKH